jgi:adenine-specific DNA-methyltransferase
MQALLAQGHEGQIDLIYIDPPFNTGENFNFPNEVTIGDKTFEKEMPMNERLAYTDTWDRGIDSFLDMLYPRLQLIKRLLSDKGSIYVHTGPNVSYFVKIIMDEIFGVENYRNDSIWQRFTFHADANRFGIVHDNILFYSKNKETIWNPPKAPLDDDYIKSHFAQTDEKGRPYTLDNALAKGDGHSRKFGDKLLYPPKGTHFRWGQAKDRLDYPTQKPETLIERIIKASFNEGNIIADFFGGSGTTAAVAEKLERRWITTDLSKTAIQVTRARFVNQNAAPFLIQNLGNYQRQLIYMRDVKLRDKAGR